MRSIRPIWAKVTLSNESEDKHHSLVSQVTEKTLDSP
jgi:hypothetical protein